MEKLKIQRGTIIMRDLGIRNTSIQRGKRPCVVVSNEKANFFSNVIMVVPLTTKATKVYPTQTLIEAGEENNLENDSMALCEQIVPINKREQLLFLIGRVTKDQMAAIEKAMLIALGVISADEAEFFDIHQVKRDLREELKLKRLSNH